MSIMNDQVKAAMRLQEMWESYWGGAYRDEEAPANLEEIMSLLTVFVKDSAVSFSRSKK